MFSSRGSRLYVGYGFTFRLGILVGFLRIIISGSDQFPLAISLLTHYYPHSKGDFRFELLS